jgi:DNA excision repair protein ERCC-1
MVDIPNHEDSLRELAKTSLVNNVTVILCWSAAEAARYLELYKSYEHANFSAIRGQQATGYAEKLVEFVTVPRAINKADAVSLVSTFGSLRHAVNADPEQVSIVGGWGERKVKAWCKAVDQPFRSKKAAKRTAKRPAAVPLREMDGHGAVKDTQPVAGGQDEFGDDDLDDLLAETAVEGPGGGPPPKQPTPQTLPPPQRQAAPQTSPPAASPSQPEQLSGGIAAALARLRDGS